MRRATSFPDPPGPPSWEKERGGPGPVVDAPQHLPDGHVPVPRPAALGTKLDFVHSGGITSGFNQAGAERAGDFHHVRWYGTCKNPLNHTIGVGAPEQWHRRRWGGACHTKQPLVQGRFPRTPAGGPPRSPKRTTPRGLETNQCCGGPSGDGGAKQQPGAA